MFDQDKVDDFFLRSESIIEKYDKDQAFKIITNELKQFDDTYLIEYAGILNYLHSEMVLDWIESSKNRIQNVSESWGHLAAMSSFSWKIACKWLSNGRPLSLIALDALIFCTTIGKRENQSLLMKEVQPRLPDKPNSDVIIEHLNEFLLTDNVPRTKGAVNKIIDNIIKA